MALCSLFLHSLGAPKSSRLLWWYLPVAILSSSDVIMRICLVFFFCAWDMICQTAPWHESRQEKHTPYREKRERLQKWGDEARWRSPKQLCSWNVNWWYGIVLSSVCRDVYCTMLSAGAKCIVHVHFFVQESDQVIPQASFATSSRQSPWQRCFQEVIPQSPRDLVPAACVLPACCLCVAAALTLYIIGMSWYKTQTFWQSV